MQNCTHTIDILKPGMVLLQVAVVSKVAFIFLVVMEEFLEIERIEKLSISELLDYLRLVFPLKIVFTAFIPHKGPKM